MSMVLITPGMIGGLITGFTFVMNANFEGILVNNVSYIVISENHVTDNNQSLNVAGATCPGIPAFETSEAMDCGEGIHLMGVDHATVAQNESDLNSGGMLLTDETGPNHDNMIVGNNIHDNPFACGITMLIGPLDQQCACRIRKCRNQTCSHKVTANYLFSLANAPWREGLPLAPAALRRSATPSSGDTPQRPVKS